MNAKVSVSNGLNIPQITSLPSVGLFAVYQSKAVFLRKHDMVKNLSVVRNETSGITELTAKEWLFLVEGYRKYSCAENRFLDNFTEQLDITAEDPILNPFSAEIADAASVDKIIGALSFLVMDYLDFLEQYEIESLGDGALEAFFKKGLESIAKVFEVSPKLLKREFEKLKWGNEELLGKQLVSLTGKRRELITESNIQSATKLREILNRSKHPNLFIMSGIEHAPVFTGSQ